MRKTILLSILTIFTLTSCGQQKNEITLPEPHENFIGKWSSNELTIYIKSDSIIVWHNRRNMKVIEVPSQKTTEFKVIKNNDFEYEILEERENKGVTLKHPFTYNKEDNSIKYVDKVVFKDEN